jgi:hypothetical protein
MLSNLASAFDERVNVRVRSTQGFSRRQALENFRRIMRANPEWSASLFDEHFFTTIVLPIIESSRSSGKSEHVLQITSAWA